MMKSSSSAKKEKILKAVKKKSEEQNVTIAEEKKSQFVVFRLNSDFFAFKGEDVKEILDYSSVTYVPGSPAYLLGIVNIRGNIESVIDLNRFLGLSDAVLENCKRIVVAEKNGIRSGILVEDVEDVIDLPENIVKEPISTLTANVRHYVSGEFPLNDRSVVLLNLSTVFDELAKPTK